MGEGRDVGTIRDTHSGYVQEMVRRYVSEYVG